MVQIGRFNKLMILRNSEFGVFLDGGKDGEILLPSRFAKGPYEVGSTLDAFVYIDSEDRLIATSETPLAEVGQFAVLEVVAVEGIGAFLDWGLLKDLFLPFAEQTRDLRIGMEVVVFLYLDKSTRISASMRIDRNINKELGPYNEGQSVDLIICGKTDLGYKAIIEGTHLGVLYENEVFQALHYAQRISGFIRKIRADGKIDLSLQKTGHQAGGEIEPLILAELEKNSGFLPINDKTSAELIYEMFGVSKKKYKIAIGGLYKKRLIVIADDGIRLSSGNP